MVSTVLGLTVWLAETDTNWEMISGGGNYSEDESRG